MLYSLLALPVDTCGKTCTSIPPPLIRLGKFHVDMHSLYNGDRLTDNTPPEGFDSFICCNSPCWWPTWTIKLTRLLKCTLAWPPWLLCVSLCLSNILPAINVHFDPADVIVKDITIVGGGASGTYAAIRLQEDFNRSVVVVEREKTSGGRTHTYYDPISSSTIELGVVAFHNLPVVHKFFSRFDIPLTKLFFKSNLPSVDLQTGRPVYVPASLKATEGTFAEWNKQLMRFPSFDEGYDSPLSVPDELSRPFDQFAQITI